MTIELYCIKVAIIKKQLPMKVVNSKNFNKNVKLDVYNNDGNKRMCVSLSCQTDLYTFEHCVIQSQISCRL